MPSIVSDVSATLSIASSQWQPGPVQAQQTEAQPFAAMLDATTAAPTLPGPPVNPLPLTANQASSNQPPSNQPPSNQASSNQAPSNQVSSNQPPSSATGNAQSVGSSGPASSGSARTASNANAANYIPNSQPAFSARSNAKTDANAPAGTGASVKTGANSASNAPIVAGAGVKAGPQTTPSAPSNLGVAYGTNRNAANTPATTNGTVNTVPVNASPPVQQTGQTASTTKASSSDGKADDGKDSNATDSAAAAATAAAPAVAQTQAAANPAQPVAAAITVNTAENSAPPPAGGSATNLTVGEQSKARAKLATYTAVAGPVAPSAQDAADATSAKEASGSTPTDTTASVEVAPADASTKAETAPARTLGQTPAEAANDPTVSTPSSGQTFGNAGRVAAQATPPSPAPTSDSAVTAPNAQGQEAAKASGIDGLPNFGFVASAAAPSSTTAAPSGMASTAAVPIAGLAVAIVARAQEGSNQFDIKLTPPELGRIDVQLNVDSNGQVTSHMTVERPETLQLLQSQQPQLQQALEQAGLTTADNGLQFSLRDQSFTGQNNGSGSQSTPTQLVIPEPELAPIAATQIYTRLGLGSGIDIRV